MERIRQALDRAREERGDARVVVAPVEPRRGADERPVAVSLHEAPPDSQRKFDPADVRTFGLDPALLERHRIVMSGSSTPASRAFRMLRAQVLQRMQERGWHTLGVVSARSGDGKTTVAANLALALAAVPDQYACLIDLDLRRPTVASTFGVEVRVGIDDVLTGSADADDVWCRPREVERLLLMPARQAVADSSEAVSGARLRGLLSGVRERLPAAYVVVDLPPVLETDDASVVAAQLDCVLFVVAEGRSQREDVARTMSLLQRFPVVGTVLNRTTDPVVTTAYG